jgi:hypothetical protein
METPILQHIWRACSHHTTTDQNFPYRTGFTEWMIVAAASEIARIPNEAVDTNHNPEFPW